MWNYPFTLNMRLNAGCKIGCQHHCGLQGHTRPNFHKLRALKNASDQRSRGPRNEKRNWVVEQLGGPDDDFRWWMWWKWLMHSPPIWQTSIEGLKVTTLVPNPIGISPQTHVMCGWRRVLLRDHLLCPCINTSNV